MSRLKEMSLPIDASRNMNNQMAVIQRPKSKYIASNTSGSYPSADMADMSAVGFRKPKMARSSNQEPSLIGGRKVKRAGNPPAVKKALKSVGKAVVKTGAKVGKDALGVVSETSGLMAERAPEMAAQALSQQMSGGKQVRRPSAWILHVKQYAAEHGVSYKDAMSAAKSTYKK